MTNEDHPELKKVQESHDLASFGAMGLGILKGALDEGATISEAIAVTAAWFRGMFGAASDNEEKGETT